MSRIIRIIAVIALALSPVWGYQADVAASGLSSPARYPVWPSFLSTGCTALQGPGGSTSVSCGGGSFLLSQINSGYECNNVAISISSFQQGSFLVVGTVDSGSQSNTVQIDGPGDYFMQFPGFLTNNLVTLQMTAGSNGSAMTIAGITSSACAVSSSTPTVNPSFTPTDTAVPVSGTPTPIATHTPLPSGHSTFTATPTPAPGTNTATATATPIPERDCGLSTFPLLNCDWTNSGIGDPSAGPLTPGTHWSNRVSGSYPISTCGNTSVVNARFVSMYNTQDTMLWGCWQQVTPGLTGHLKIQYNFSNYSGTWYFVVTDSGTVNSDGTYDSGTQTRYGVYDSGCGYNSDPTSPMCVIDLGTVTSGSTVDIGIGEEGSLGNWDNGQMYILDTWVSTSTSDDTPTPAPATATITGTIPPTSTPTITPVPIPGAMSTAIATSTECPGGCAVAALTDVPGIATRITVDTSPFSPFTSLSLARSDCKPFGYVQIPYPVIHGTPALGSSIPLSVTWTAPVTHDWDNSNPYSNTAIQPCAMDVINYINGTPTHIWDLTYWMSVLAIAIVFIMWLIGFVGRLSGDETING